MPSPKRSTRSGSPIPRTCTKYARSHRAGGTRPVGLQGRRSGCCARVGAKKGVPCQRQLRARTSRSSMLAASIMYQVGQAQGSRYGRERRRGRGRNVLGRRGSTPIGQRGKWTRDRSCDRRGGSNFAGLKDVGDAQTGDGLAAPGVMAGENSRRPYCPNHGQPGWQRSRVWNDRLGLGQIPRVVELQLPAVWAWFAFRDIYRDANRLTKGQPGVAPSDTSPGG